MVCGVATGVSKGAKGQYQYSGLGRCVRLRNKLGRRGGDGDCSIGDGAGAEGRDEKGEADGDGRQKRRGREDQEGTIKISGTMFWLAYTNMRCCCKAQISSSSASNGCVSHLIDAEPVMAFAVVLQHEVR